MALSKHLICSAICTALLASAPARADSVAQLVSLINAYRSAPGSCDGRPASPAGPLTPQRALAAVRIGPGTLLEHALDRAGYASVHAEAINVFGPPDPEAVMALIEKNYCSTLLRAEFSDVGAARTGDAWQIILAQPVPALTLADWTEAGKTILEAVNSASPTRRPPNIGSRPGARSRSRAVVTPAVLYGAISSGAVWRIYILPIALKKNQVLIFGH